MHQTILLETRRIISAPTGCSLSQFPDLRAISQRIAQLRPFDSMPGVGQRYFFAGSNGRIPGSADSKTDVGVEQNRDGKHLEVSVPKDLLANLV